MEERELKALQIAAKSKLTRRGKTWLVPSQSVRGAQHTVKLDPQEPQCSCPDFDSRKQRCKHIFAVEYTVEREQTSEGETIFTESFKVTRRTYSQNWSAYNLAQTQEKAELQSLLHELCRSIPEPEQYRGRPRLPLFDMIFASAFKIYSTSSARWFMTDLREANERGYLRQLPFPAARNSARSSARTSTGMVTQMLWQTILHSSSLYCAASVRLRSRSPNFALIIGFVLSALLRLWYCCSNPLLVARVGSGVTLSFQANTDLPHYRRSGSV